MSGPVRLTHIDDQGRAHMVDVSAKDVTHREAEARCTVRTTADVAAVLPGGDWDVLAAEARPRPAVDPEGRDVTVHDAVTVARRRVGPPAQA